MILRPKRLNCAPADHTQADCIQSAGMTDFLKGFFLIRGKFKVYFIPLILRKIKIFFLKFLVVFFSFFEDEHCKREKILGEVRESWENYHVLEKSKNITFTLKKCVVLADCNSRTNTMHEKKNLWKFRGKFCIYFYRQCAVVTLCQIMQVCSCLYRPSLILHLLWVSGYPSCCKQSACRYALYMGGSKLGLVEVWTVICHKCLADLGYHWGPDSDTTFSIFYISIHSVGKFCLTAI